MKLRANPGKISTYSLLILFSVIFILPFLILLSNSLKNYIEIVRFPPSWIPEKAEWSNYVRVFTKFPFGLYFWNSILYSGLSTLGIVLSSSVVAFGLARVDFPGKNLLFAITLATLMIPFQLLIIPQFMLFQKIGWTDSFKPLIVPRFFGAAYYIFLFRQFFLGIPKDLDEAAKIDGCNPLSIYWKIIMPLSRPVIMVATLFCVVWTWKDFLGPLVFTTDPSLRTVTLGLYFFTSMITAGGSEWPAFFAAATLSLVPLLILFVFGQRYFVQGVNMTGIRG